MRCALKSREISPTVPLAGFAREISVSVAKAVRLLVAAAVMSSSIGAAATPSDREVHGAVSTVLQKGYETVDAATSIFSTTKAILQLVGYIGSGDPIKQALELTNERLTILEDRVNKIEQWLTTLQNDERVGQNRDRVTRLRALHLQLQAIAIDLDARPADPRARMALARKAQLFADEFPRDAFLWEWSDVVQVEHQRNGRTLKVGDMLPPDFKPLPVLEYYATALVIWMATLDFAGQADAVIVRTGFGDALKRHIDFLGERPLWRETMPAQLPSEKIRVRITSTFVPDKYPSGGKCTVWLSVRDEIRRLVDSEPLTYPEFRRNVLCNVPPGIFNRKPEEETKMEGEHGIDLMKALQTKLSRLRTTGSVMAPVAETTPLFAPGAHVPKGEPVVIYAVDGEGYLRWFRHDGASDGSAAWAPDRRVGVGWRHGIKRVFPDSGGVIYALADDGTLRWLRHKDPVNGTESWDPGPIDVRGDMGGYRHVFSGGEGVIYAVAQNGDLLWFRYLRRKTGDTGPNAWRGPVRVGTGWSGLRHVFGGGHGLVYAVLADGTLRRLRHLGWAEGSENWGQHRDIAKSWGSFRHVFSGGEGLLYAVTPAGDLLWYRDWGARLARPLGKNMVGPHKVGSGWGAVQAVFASLPEEPPPVR
jgi:hypothetical protein